MPCVIQKVSKQFRREPLVSINPDEVVALGAAVQAGLIDSNKAVDDLVVTDVAPFTMGIEISKEFVSGHKSGYYLPIIHRNTPIPISRIERVYTIKPNQTTVNVSVYQGESRRVEQNLQLAKFSVTGIPRRPDRQPIDIRFTYDLNGILEVEATIVETQSKICRLVIQHTHSMTPAEIKEAVERMQAIKHHPRDETENRSLLLQAERLYTELPLSDQQRLADLLDGFEAVLEINDKSAIEEFRNELRIFLESFND